MILSVSKRITGSPSTPRPIHHPISGNLLSCGVQPPTPPCTPPSNPPARHVTGPSPPPPPPCTPWAAGQRAAAPAPARPPASARHFLFYFFLLLLATRLTPKSKRLRCPGGRSGSAISGRFRMVYGPQAEFSNSKSLLLSGP